jgi:hypothetical protein
MASVYSAAIDQATVLMAQRISYSGDNAEYIGFANAGAKVGDAKWIIQKLSYDSSSKFLSRTFAEGNMVFDKRWTKRTEYTYA